MAKSPYGNSKKSGPKVPNFFDEKDSAEGFEDITSQTMAIPFVRILQTLSPQLNKKKPEFVDGAQEGMFFNTVTKEVYGTNINVIVLKFERIFIEWLPDRGGLVNYHTPEHAEKVAVDKAQFGAWKTSTGNFLQENYVYYCIIQSREDEGIIIISLSSTGIKVAREWNRLMTTHIMENGKRALPYYLIWTLESEYRENDKGNWYTFNVTTKAYINQKQYAVVGDERKILPSRRVDYAQLTDETEESVDEKVPF